jgi:hypothetical protein
LLESSCLSTHDAGEIIDGEILDEETLVGIVSEIDVTNKGTLDFEQFLVAVELVNSIYILFEQERDLMLEEEDNDDENYTDESIPVTGEVNDDTEAFLRRMTKSLE